MVIHCMEQAAYFTERQQASHDAVDPPAQQTRQTDIPAPSENTTSDAKRYARIRLQLSLLGAAAYFLLSIVLLASGATRLVEQAVRHFAANDYLALLGFTAVLGMAETILTLPLQYYSGFHLEHKYNLSNQTLWRWIWEGLKGLLVSIPIATPLILAFFYCLRSFGSLWWLPVGLLLFLFSVVLARLGPVLIFPLFYKFQPLPDGELKSKILDLCRSVGMSVQGVFVFDMSKNTKKANAAFAGIGKSKRIILGDTLVANFRDEEIETVFAHELGHYKLRHIMVMMALGTLSSFVGLYFTAVLYEISLKWFGFTSIDQIAALPLLAVWLGVYSLVTAPLTNIVSRSHERAADKFAIRSTGNAEAFGTALRKIAAINLADVSPHPVVEFLFHSHPSIEKRIQALGLAVSPSVSGSQK
jgi:STE24 endopeptidase